MDLCAVLRGSKRGVEVLLKQKAPHILNIDGDICHCIHNSAKQFCKVFDFYLERLFIVIHTDFKYSTDMRDVLKEICEACDLTFTMSE